jgi:hypothetical protein
MDFSKLQALTIPEGIVVKIMSGASVLWEKVTSLLPKEYQQVEWIEAIDTTEAYIDLGFAFDGEARIVIGQYIVNEYNTYVFGAAENSGILRCMLSSPYDKVSRAYGSTGTTYINRGVSYQLGLNEIAINFVNNKLSIINRTTGSNGNDIGQRQYTMTNNLYLFAQNYNGTPRFGSTRSIGYFTYHDKNNVLICNLIPCYRRSDGEIGMYDTVRKIFLTNVGSGSFTKGANVGDKDIIQLTFKEGITCTHVVGSACVESKSAAYYVTENAEAQANTSYTITNNDNTDILTSGSMRLIELDSNGIVVQVTQLANANIGMSYTFTTSANTSYIKLRGYATELSQIQKWNICKIT